MRRRGLGALAILVAGCAAETAPDAGPIARVRAPIVGGVRSGAEHDAVVILAHFSGGTRRTLCTATAVAPTLIVTARHCVSVTDPDVICTASGATGAARSLEADRPAATLAVFAGAGGEAPDISVDAAAEAHGARLVVSSGTTVCDDDLAFVILDRPLAAYAPVTLGRASVGEEVQVIGWGLDETGALGRTRRARADVPVLGVGPASYAEDPRGGYGVAELAIGESACIGDSGGPALTSSGAVLGVASRAENGNPTDPANRAAPCTGGSIDVIFGMLGGHEELVRRAVVVAGEPLWLDGEPDPRAPEPAPPRATEKRTTKATLDVPPPAPAAEGCATGGRPRAPSAGVILGLAALAAVLRRRGQ